jgi:adenylate cyclase
VEALQTSAGQRPEMAWEPSRYILRKLVEEKRTLWQVPEVHENMSLQGIKAVVAAPILDRQARVIAALYGDRRQDGLHAGRRITKMEGLLVELLAGIVAAGLARVDQEKAALRSQAQMESYFGPRLAKRLSEQQELLQGRDTEVTVLFADIRGFSRVSEKLGPAGTVQWIGDALGTLSECVLRHEGVVVDYIGDELMAMWGAPDQQPDHARRAGQAALDMLAALPQLNTRWQPQLGATTDLGIGINTGVARVGNVGSSFRLKYGPLGDTVNLASRVQGANKYLKTRLLLTEDTQRLIQADFPTRRVCTVRVVNIERPIVLYELLGPYGERGDLLKKGYEEALDQFEKQDFRLAARTIGNLLRDFPNDGPSLVLISRAVQCMVEEKPAPHHPVWELPGK